MSREPEVRIYTDATLVSCGHVVAAGGWATRKRKRGSQWVCAACDPRHVGKTHPQVLAEAAARTDSDDHR